jgi:hypothetical protein
VADSRESSRSSCGKYSEERLTARKGKLKRGKGFWESPPAGREKSLGRKKPRRVTVSGMVRESQKGDTDTGRE